MWAGVFLWGSFASLYFPTGRALWLKEGVHMHAGRPQKKVLLEKYCRISQVESVEMFQTALNFNQNPDVCCWAFLSLVSAFCLGKFKFIVPQLRSIQIKSGAGMDSVTPGPWEMNLAQSWYHVSYWYSVIFQLEGAWMLFYYFFWGDRF